MKLVHEDVSSIRYDSTAIREDVSQLRQFAATDREQRQAEDNKAMQRELRTWLVKTDPQRIYEEIREKPIEGSGIWFVNEHFAPWLALEPERESQILWLHGRSGAGKTTLASLAVDHLKRRIHDEHDAAFAYFYCSFNDKVSQRPTTVLGALIWQLCIQLPALWADAAAVYAELNARDLRDLDLDNLLKLFDAARRLTGKIFILLDGPNECESPHEVLEVLQRMVKNNKHLRLLISSTDDLEVGIVGQGKQLLAVNMDLSRVHDDIRAYLEQKVQRERRLRRLPKTLQQKVIEQIIANCEGSFRWAICQLISIIENARSEATVEQSLRGLAPTLENLYTDALLAIPSSDTDLIRNALLWLTFSIRPMTIEEIGEAMTYALEIKDIDPTKKLFIEEAEDVLRRCPMLIDYNANARRASLAHSSVHDYLLSDTCRTSRASTYALDEEETTLELACLCMSYLNMDGFANGYCANAEEIISRKDRYALWNYVSKAWPSYVRLSMANSSSTAHHERLEPGLVKFFETVEMSRRGGNFGSWVQAFKPSHLRPGSDLPTPLYYAARQGLPEVCKLILHLDSINGGLSPGRPASSQLERLCGSRTSTPLHAAAAFGHDECVKILLEAGADANETNGFDERGVEWAAYHGWDNIVCLYEQHGGDPVDPARVRKLEELVSKSKQTAKNVKYFVILSRILAMRHKERRAAANSEHFDSVVDDTASTLANTGLGLAEELSPMVPEYESSKP